MNVAQLCPSLCNPMDYVVHGILQSRLLEWGPFPSPGYCSRESPKSNVVGALGRRRKETETEGRQPQKATGRDWHYASVKQGMPRAARSWRRQDGLFLWEALGQQGLANYFVFKLRYR